MSYVKRKQISSEHNVPYWPDCGSGRVDHSWHMCIHFLFVFYRCWTQPLMTYFESSTTLRERESQGGGGGGSGEEESAEVGSPLSATPTSSHQSGDLRVLPQLRAFLTASPRDSHVSSIKWITRGAHRRNSSPAATLLERQTFDDNPFVGRICGEALSDGGQAGENLNSMLNYLIIHYNPGS